MIKILLTGKNKFRFISKKFKIRRFFIIIFGA